MALRDAQTGTAITNARVILSHAGGSEELFSSYVNGQQQAIYRGAYDQAGTFDLEIQAPDHESLHREGLVAHWQQCHLVGVQLELELEPTPSPTTLIILGADGEAELRRGFLEPEPSAAGSLRRGSAPLPAGQ